MMAVDKREKYSQYWLIVVLLVGLCGLLLCIVFSASPMYYKHTPPVKFADPISTFMLKMSAWLPTHIYAGKNQVDSLLGTVNIEVILLLMCMCVVYIGTGWFIWRQKDIAKSRWVWSILWVGVFVAGILFICMPALLSKDLYVYGDYGHVMVAHGVNPYFVPPWNVKGDSLRWLNDWGFSVSTYGPIWMYVCAIVAMVGGDDPLRYIYAFRFLGLLCHVLNMLLIWNILRLAGRSERIVLLGVFLYAWSPLALLEVVMGAHNDGLFCTFLLLCVYLSLIAEKKGFSQPLYYVLPFIALALAVLVKFTALPLIAPLILLLIYKTGGLTGWSGWRVWWKSVLGRVMIASVVFIAILGVCYLPMWWGHSLQEIVYSFSSPPSSKLAQNSLLRATREWLKVHEMPKNGIAAFFVGVFNNRSFWNALNILGLGSICLVSVYSFWRMPRVQTMIIVSLTMMSVLLLVTPWFYPWYVSWILVLAVAALSAPLGRWGRTCIAFALTFSLTSLFMYYDLVYIPFVAAGYGLFVRVFVMMFIPVMVGVMVWMRERR